MGPGGGGRRPSIRQAFVSLKLRNYRFLWFSQLAAFTGMQMQIVAQGLLAYQLTGSYASVGIVMLGSGIPQMFLSLVGGAVADRVNKRNLVIGVQFGTAMLALAIAVLTATDVITIPILFVAGVIQGTLFAFNLPARQALLAEIVPHDQLVNAVALNNVAMNSTRVAGPAVAGIMIAAWGVEAAFFAQAFMYLFVIGFLVRLPASTSHLEGAAQRGSVFNEITIGLRYIWDSPTLRLLMVMAFVPTLLGMPYFTLLPGFAVDELGLEADSYGFMFTVTGIGAIVGSIAIATLTDFPRKGLLQIGAGAGFGISLVLLGILSVAFGYGGAIAALIVLGLCSTMYQTLNATMVMSEARPEFYGRVMSVYMLTFSVFPLMATPIGVVADAISASTTFLVLGGGILAFIAAITLASPSRLLRVGNAESPAEFRPPEAAGAQAPADPGAPAAGGG